ncbi:MAG TPA: hypothetical protein VGC44_02350 [Longimicrobiales bacterium]
MKPPPTPKQAIALTAVLIAASLPVVLLHGLMSSAVALQATVQPGDAYWQPAHFALIYLAVPLLALSACVFVLVPGLLLSLGVMRPRNLGEWLLQGFALSLLLLSVALAITHTLTPGAVSRTAFLLTYALVLVACALALIARTHQGQTAWPADDRSEFRQLVPMLIAPAIICAVLAPKFLWENFNGDGAHAFEASRLLVTQALPFWNPTAGDVANWPGTTSMLFTYPTSWFIQLFGPVEISARLPVLLYLLLVCAAVSSLSQRARGRSLSMTESGLLWLALYVYTVAVGYSGTYSPYSADLALPGTQDTLVVVCFLGFILAAERQSAFWLSMWGLFTFLTLPNGILLMALWGAATLFVWRPLPVRLVVTILAIGIACVLVSVLLPRIVVAFGAFAPGKELKTGNLLDRFNHVQLTDFKRFLYVILPCGILPAFALAAWRRQDNLSRTITAVTIAYFAITYIQAYASLHYYIPAMLLPLAVFWRIDWVDAARRRVFLGATATASLLALWLSWPTSAVPYLAARQVGAAVEDRVGGYDVSSAEQFRASALLNKLLPPDWHPSVPRKAHGGSALTWNFYAHVPNNTPDNYILQRARDVAPMDAAQVASDGEFSLFVRDSAIWTQHRELRPHSPAGARIYQIPRAVLFKSGSEGLRIFNVKRILRKLF